MSRYFIVGILFFLNGFISEGHTYEPPTASQYFEEWVEGYKSISEGSGPIPVEIIENEYPSDIIFGDKENYDDYLKKDNNQSSVILKNGKLVYETYNNRWSGSSDFLIHGQSMTKAISGLTIGALICSERLLSINDPIGKYSETIKNTLYDKVSIREALQMRSGISKYNTADGWNIWWMQTGNKDKGFEGKNYLKKYIKTIRSSNGNGEISEYHPHDTFALSIMVSELTSKSLAANFNELIFSKIQPSGNIVWMTDADGITLPGAGLFLNARDWAKIGDFILQSLDENNCMGKFIKDGIDNAVASSRTKGWKFGYHFWTDDDLLIMAGFGGQTIYINPNKKSVVMASSVNPKYGDKYIFEIAREISLK